MSVLDDPLINGLPNSSFTASSIYNYGEGIFEPYCMPYRAAYDTDAEWCANYAAEELEYYAGEIYLEIDLLDKAQIFAVGTKGGTFYEEWVTSYTFSYSVNGYNWTYYLDATSLTGNTDQYTEVKHVLNTPIIAQYIRFYPLTAYNWVSMRVEAYGSYDINATLAPLNSDTFQTCMYILSIHSVRSNHCLNMNIQIM